MRMIPCDIENVEGGYYTRTKNYKYLKSFADSDLNCVEVVDYDHKNAYSCSASLKKTILNFKMYNIESFTRRGKVYLIKIHDKKN